MEEAEVLCSSVHVLFFCSVLVIIYHHWCCFVSH